MSDFFKIDTRPGKRGVTEIYPKFIVGKPNDLMIRGSDFYAIWMEERGLWSTDEQDVIRTIDRELRTYADEYQKTHNNGFHVLYMWDAESGMIDNWHKYCQRQMRDNFHPLDEVLIFSNTPVKKESYASKRLPYPLEPGSINAYDELMGVLYSPEEREKLEWAIGAVVNGASKEVQKFIVLYGDPGSGKSTVLNIVQMHNIAEAVFGEELDVIQTYIPDPPSGTNQALWYLGESIKMLSEADYFIGVYDEEKAYHGCAIENQAAKAYGIPSYTINLNYVARDVVEARAKEARKYSCFGY